MERDIPLMDIVYKKAFANIVAISGNDADAGLAGLTSKSRPPQLIEILPILKNPLIWLFLEMLMLNTRTFVSLPLRSLWHML